MVPARDSALHRCSLNYCRKNSTPLACAHPPGQVLREPQPHFELIKRHYPHYIHRRARNGCPVWIELPGRIDLPAIRSAGVSPEALQRHYVFVTEYMWGVLEPDFENGQAVTVLDVQGLGMRDLAGEALGFVKVQQA